MLQSIEQKIGQTTPISREEARWLYTESELPTLSRLSTAVRNRYHSPHEATYLIMAIINYTNICVAGCDYCAFYRFPHEEGAYLKSFDEVVERVERLVSFGGTLVGFNGGFHPKLSLPYYAEFFRMIHKRFPELGFKDMTVAEFMFACKLSKLSYDEGAKVLKDAGTRWIPGGGAEVLDEDFRKRHSPGKYKVSDFFSAQKAILEAGLGSTATMVIGFDESLEERLSHLETLRKFQDDTGRKLPSFLCWTYKPYNTKLGGKEISTEEYLRWLAVSRIFLHNFKHIRTSVLTRNEDALLGLKYGADDFDLPLEDEVTEKAGAHISEDFDSLLASARKLGFHVKKRKPFEPTYGIWEKEFVESTFFEKKFPSTPPPKKL
ncbi:MAG: radical SAM protein [Deltaproteobacteria bacterium]|nr:radical SAM protein [Deltaproteobacteria bacterium]